MFLNTFKIALKNYIKSLFKDFGLEIRRIKKGKKLQEQLCRSDAYSAQKELLANQTVGTIFDVGANIGQTASEYCKLFETSIIYCFEPFEESYAMLSKKFDNTDNVRTFKLAIAEQSGKRRFYFNKANYTNSLLEVAHNSGKYVDANLTYNLGYVDVVTISIDEFCKEENMGKIHVLKMDIQGAELMALQGAIDLLRSHSIDLIYTEVLFAKLYEGQAYFFDLYKFLAQYGYILYGLYDLNYGKNGVLAWCDAIFVSPDLEASLN